MSTCPPASHLPVPCAPATCNASSPPLPAPVPRISPGCSRCPACRSARPGRLAAAQTPGRVQPGGVHPGGRTRSMLACKLATNGSIGVPDWPFCSVLGVGRCAPALPRVVKVGINTEHPWYTGLFPPRVLVFPRIWTLQPLPSHGDQIYYCPSFILDLLKRPERIPLFRTSLARHNPRGLTLLTSFQLPRPQRLGTLSSALPALYPAGNPLPHPPSGAPIGTLRTGGTYSPHRGILNSSCPSHPPPQTKLAHSPHSRDRDIFSRHQRRPISEIGDRNIKTPRCTPRRPPSSRRCGEPA